MNLLRRLATAALVALSLATLVVPNAYAVTIDMVTVGDPGNAADTTGYGGVAYEYQIGKYEITIGQYTEFLNAVAKADPFLLYNTNMNSDRNVAGIRQTGSSGAYVYEVSGPFGDTQLPQATSAARPISYVAWFDAARFANWMSNGQPTGPQGPATTENGAYALNGITSGNAPALNATNPNTGSTPLFRIPTENEWYKAAFYKGGGTNSGYWAFATQSEAQPSNTAVSGANQANWRSSSQVFFVTQASQPSAAQNYLVNVGTFTDSPSAYGTFDQSGNVWEWNDLTGDAGSVKGIRGGNWDAIFSQDLSSFGRLVNNPANESFDYDWGFRLAAPVPEPTTYAMALAGLACGGYTIFRGRKRA